MHRQSARACSIPSIGSPTVVWESRQGLKSFACGLSPCTIRSEMMCPASVPLVIPHWWKPVATHRPLAWTAEKSRAAPGVQLRSRRRRAAGAAFQAGSLHLAQQCMTRTFGWYCPMKGMRSGVCAGGNARRVANERSGGLRVLHCGDADAHGELLSASVRFPLASRSWVLHLYLMPSMSGKLACGRAQKGAAFQNTERACSPRSPARAGKLVERHAKSAFLGQQVKEGRRAADAATSEPPHSTDRASGALQREGQERRRVVAGGARAVTQAASFPNRASTWVSSPGW